MRLKSRAKLGRRGSEGRGSDRDDGKAWAGGKGREKGNRDGERPTRVGLREQGPGACPGSGIVKVDEGSALKTKKK